MDALAAVLRYDVPLDVKLPGAAFKGTPTNVQTNSYTEPYSDAPPAPLMVPEGLKNLAPAAKLSTSSTNVSVDKLSKIVDGDKEAADGSVAVVAWLHPAADTAHLLSPQRSSDRSTSAVSVLVLWFRAEGQTDGSDHPGGCEVAQICFAARELPNRAVATAGDVQIAVFVEG